MDWWVYLANCTCVHCKGDAMEILKHKTKTKLKTIKCECGCKFRFHPDTEAKYNSDNRDGDYYSIKCPECKELHTWQAV